MSLKLNSSGGGSVDLTAPSIGSAITVTLPSATGTLVGTGSTTAANIVMASGVGIDFSATSDGSGTVTSEILTDYEEGTWVPVTEGTTTAGVGTYGTRTGRYTKIGRRVFFSCVTAWSAHTGTGNLKITGLPYTANATFSGCVCTVAANNLLMTAGHYPWGYVNNGEAAYYLYSTATGGGAPIPIAMDTSVDALYINGSYEV